MTRVQKFPLSLGVNDIHLPAGAEVLSVEAKSDGAAVYALVPDESADIAMSPARFVAVETGAVIDAGDEPLTPGNSTFLGTVRHPGHHTWHVWRVAVLPSALAPDPDEAPVEEPVA